MNRRDLVAGAVALAAAAVQPAISETGEKYYTGYDRRKPEFPAHNSGATKTYYEIAPLRDDFPVHSVRVTVTLKDDAPDGFWHPVDFVNAARWFAAQAQKGYEVSPDSFGPHDESKFKF
jgi:hypothetical protein